MKQDLVFFNNYDYGEDSESGPGTGLYSDLDNYKSVKDFLEKKRKEKSNIKKRAFIKESIDFSLPSDNCISDPSLGLMDNVNPPGGMVDPYVTLPDEEGKGVWDLNIGRDLESKDSKISHPNEEIMSFLTGSSFLGMNADMEEETGPFYERNEFNSRDKTFRDVSESGILTP